MTLSACSIQTSSTGNARWLVHNESNFGQAVGFIRQVLGRTDAYKVFLLGKPSSTLGVVIGSLNEAVCLIEKAL